MHFGVDESRRSARARCARSNGATAGPDRPTRLLLAADVGRLHTDLAIVSCGHSTITFVAERRYPTGGHPGLADMARAFMVETELEVEAACVSVQCPVTRGEARLAEPKWQLNEAELGRLLAVERVWLLDHVVATASAIPTLPPAQLHRVKDGEPTDGGTIVLLIPGERLGVGLLVPDLTAASGYRAHPSAGGFAAAAPMTPAELELVHHLWHGCEHPSLERAPSAMSIPEIYEFLADRDRLIESPHLAATLPSARDRTRAIVEAACDRVEFDPLARCALELYLQILGAHAANLALTVLASGGIYLAGKLARRLRHELVSAAFLEPLLRAGMASEPLERVPVFVLRRDVALLGAAHEGLSRWSAAVPPRPAAAPA